MKKQIKPAIEFEFMSEEMISTQHDLEQIILGEILIDSEAMYRIGSDFQEFLFHDKKHQKLASALKHLFSQNQQIDLVTLSKRLMETDSLKEIGGVSVVSSLTNRVASSTNLEVHFRMLQENFLRRFVVQLNTEANSKALNFGDDIFETIETQINSYTDALNGLMSKQIDVVGQIHTELIRQHVLYSDNKNFSGVPTFLKLVDNLTNGWQKSDLINLAGRPAMGKTSCAITFALNPAIQQNIPVAIFSLEMSKEQLVSRMQSILSTLNVSRLVKKQLIGSEIIALEEKTKALETAPIYIDDTAGISLIELKTKARKLVREKGVQMIVIDYLQLMRSGNRNQPREQEIGEISRGLKGIAKELNIPVIALSQLSRQVEGRGGNKKPQLSDLRESGQIEQDADMVMFCYRPEYYEIAEYEINEQEYNTDGLFLLLVAKHRNGSLGDIPLKFIHENTAIVNNPYFMPLENGFQQPIVEKPSNSIRPNGEFDLISENDEDMHPF
jgi:replicative DNA helicase